MQLITAREGSIYFVLPIVLYLLYSPTEVNESYIRSFTLQIMIRVSVVCEKVNLKMAKYQRW